MPHRLAPLVLSLGLLGCQAPAQPPAATEAAPALAVAPAPVSIAAASGFVYVGSASTGAITVIDAKTDQVVKTIENDGGAVSFLGAFTDDRHVLALDKKRNQAMVIDPARDHAVIQTIPLAGGPSKAILSPDNPTVMVALENQPQAVLLTFDETDRAKAPEVKRFAVGAGQSARDIGYDHDWVVAPNPPDGSLSLFDVKTEEVRAIAGAGDPKLVWMGVWGGIARRALVADPGAGQLSMYEIPGGEKTLLEGLGREPAALRGEENLRRAYVAMRGSDELVVIDYDKKRLFGRVPVGAQPSTIAITTALPSDYQVQHEEDDNPREVWVGNAGDRTVTVVDAATLLVKSTLAVGAGPHHVTFSGAKAYVANQGAGTVTILDRRQ